MQKKRLILLGGGLAVILLVSLLGLLWQSRQAGSVIDVRQNILLQDRELNLTYSGYQQGAIWDISDFEEKSDKASWKGNGFYDDRVALAGDTSLSLTSTNREAGVAYLEDLPPLQDVKNFELAVKVTDPEDLESLTLFAGSTDEPRAYSFPMANLNTDWNILKIAKDKFVFNSEQDQDKASSKTENAPAGLAWDKVTRIEFRLISRPGVTIIANLDGLRGETEEGYRDDWNVSFPAFIGLSKQDDQVYLLGRGIGTQAATIRSITAAKNYTYQAKLIPRTDKRAGLFFRGDFRSNNGYMFWVGGIGQSTWGLFSRNGGIDEVLAVDQLTNVQFRAKEPIWLRVQTNGENISLFISLDGEQFTKLKEVADTTFIEPSGVGVYVEGGGEVLFNDFMFSQ